LRTSFRFRVSGSSGASIASRKDGRASQTSFFLLLVSINSFTMIEAGGEDGMFISRFDRLAEGDGHGD
jgi:hypothetical protein